MPTMGHYGALWGWPHTVTPLPLFQGCSFGYHAGGWGKPPVDETGKPLYGDVFGTNAAEFQVRPPPTSPQPPQTVVLQGVSAPTHGPPGGLSSL